MSDTRRFVLLLAFAIVAGLGLTITLQAVEGWRDQQTIPHAQLVALRAENAQLTVQVTDATHLTEDAKDRTKAYALALERADGRELLCYTLLRQSRVGPASLW